jgi:hypothetical protein
VELERALREIEKPLKEIIEARYGKIILHIKEGKLRVIEPSKIIKLD